MLEVTHLSFCRKRGTRDQKKQAFHEQHDTDSTGKGVEEQALDGDESPRSEEERLGCGRSASRRVSLQRVSKSRSRLTGSSTTERGNAEEFAGVSGETIKIQRVKGKTRRSDSTSLETNNTTLPLWHQERLK
ncbi:hypothetical protein OJAV_G00183100 [Oryzias javanicus]|uniref:Uncharacterized protein n=1 Tax=Oryzias javanicus TaxID=123683 RepID=A0A437CEE0_ORYJA|nr:hypothetical protein OJAV_G00183100 [Oryzias javanicus]